MAKRRALVIDRDADFVGLLRENLVPYGFEIVDTQDSREGLAWLKAEPPEILFLAVELPEREGFGLCTRVRRMARGARIVLETASLPWNEMALHEITRAHADLYLDKRGLDGDKLIRMLERIVVFGPGDADPAVARTPAPGTMAAAEGPVAEAVARAADVLLETVVGPGAEPAAPAPSEAAPTLEEEAARLRLRLEEARVAVRNSPTAVDNLLLRDQLHDKEEELVRLQGRALAQERRLATAQEQQRELARQAAAEKLEKEQHARTIEGLTARLESVENMLALAKEEIEELHRQADEELRRECEAHRGTRADLERRLAEREAARAAAERRCTDLQADYARLEQQAAELEKARTEGARQAQEVLARTRGEQAAAAFAAELKHESALKDALKAQEREQRAALEAAIAARLESAGEEHRAELAQQEAGFRAEREIEQGRHEKAIAALRKIHSEMLAEKDRTWTAAQERVGALEAQLAETEKASAAAQERVAQLEAAAREQEERLATERQEHGATRHALETAQGLAKQLQESLDEKQAAFDAAEETQRRTLEGVRRESTIVLEALRREQAEELAAQRERERQLVDARTREGRAALDKTTDELDAFRAQARERTEEQAKEYARRLAEIEAEKREAARRAEEDLAVAGSRVAELEQALTAASQAATEKDAAIADQRATISSLQELIGDLSAAAGGASPGAKPSLR